MRQVIAIGFERSNFELLEDQISSCLNVNTILKQNIQDALSLIDLLPKIRLFIVAASIPRDELKILSQTQSIVERKINVMAMSEGVGEKLQNVTFVPLTTSPEKLLQTVATLAETQIAYHNQDEDKFSAIPIQHFLGLGEVFCDVYIRIIKAHQKPQFVKRIKAGDILDNETIEKYMNDGLEYLYIPSEYKHNFRIFYSNRMISQLQNEELSQVQKAGINSQLTSVIRENILNVGFDEMTVELTLTSISNMMETIQESRELSHLYEMITVAETSFSYKLNILTTAAIHKILLETPWCKSEHKRKLTFAVFFKDIVLSDVRLIDVRTPAQLEALLLSKEEKTLVQKHAFLSSVLIRKVSEIPVGVDELVKEHHGDKNGLVLKEFPDAEIAPLSRILFLAEEFAYRCLHAGGKPDMHKILIDMKEKFSQDLNLKVLGPWGMP